MTGRSSHHPCPYVRNKKRRQSINRASHFQRDLLPKTSYLGFIFASYLFVFGVCMNIVRGSDVPPSPVVDLELNPLLLNFTQALRNSPFSKELEAASTNTTTCSSPSYTWSIARIAEMGYDKYQYLSNSYITIMPFIYSIYIDKSEDDEYFGTNGGQTTELLQRHDLAQTFWGKSNNVAIENVLLLGAHGSILSDPQKLLPTIKLMFPSMTNDRMNEFFGEIYDLVNTIPDTFNNPLLSLNAIATPGGDVLNTGEIFPAATVIGDGIIDKLIDINLGSNGPDFVHAHEVAHQVQFDLGVYDDDGNNEASPTDTRNKELMADAFSAYFLSHDQGGDMDTMQILELHQTAFTIGDCSFDSKTHHGTPSQRRCASMWGASQAMDNTDIIIDPVSLRANFENSLHDIVSLSSDICPLPEEHDSVVECSDEMTSITVKIKLDGFAVETVWFIKANDDNTTYATKSYSKLDDFSTVYNAVCIHPQKEYTFFIIDAHGDGIIDGYYNIFNGTNETVGALLLEGHGSFGLGTSAPFSLSLCPGMMIITIVVQLDQYAFETSWVIKGAADQVEYESASYKGDDQNSIVSETVCVHMEKEYTFSIRDSYGDGILNGYYKIYNGTNVTDETSLLIEGDGTFENGTDVHFSPSLCPNKVPITINIQLDQYPFETSWALRTADDGIEFAGKWYLKEEKHAFVTEIVCCETGQQYEFKIEDRYGDGIIDGFYKVFVDTSGEDENILVEGQGDFGNEKSIEFAVA